MEAPIFVYKYTKFSDCEIILDWMIKTLGVDITFTHSTEYKWAAFRWEQYYKNLNRFYENEVEICPGLFFVAIMNKEGAIECKSSKECPYCHECEEKPTRYTALSTYGQGLKETPSRYSDGLSELASNDLGKILQNPFQPS